MKQKRSDYPVALILATLVLLIALITFYSYKG